jgi:hypothetical protein
MRILLLTVAIAVVGCGGGCSGGKAGPTGSAGSGGGGNTTGTAGVTGSAGTTGSGAGGQFIGSSGCTLFTPNDPWNADVSGGTVNTTWTNQINALLGAVNIHPDFGADFGIPINVVPANQAKVPIVFDAYPEESDPGPYPFPGPGAVRVEGTTNPANCDSDCHVIAVQQGSCQAYEAWACHYASDGWHCGNGAKWDLTRISTGQRPDDWTSADAAGLSIYAGLARYEEVMAGEITHAIRFTLPCTADSRVPPATHTAGHCAGANSPPMGIRVRLKAGYDISGFGPVAQTFLRAFKKHGLLLADNGGSSSTFYFQSEDNPNWPDEINDLKRVPVSAFEAVNP